MTHQLVSPDGKHQKVNLAKLRLADVEQLLGGPLEVVQLGEFDCLLTNANARELGLAKNKSASRHWFTLHEISGAASDFILGPAILCANHDITHLNHLTCEVKPVLTSEQRRARQMQQFYQPLEAAPVCTMEEGCVSCGS